MSKPEFNKQEQMLPVVHLDTTGPTEVLPPPDKHDFVIGNGIVEFFPGFQLHPRDVYFTSKDGQNVQNVDPKGIVSTIGHDILIIIPSGLLPKEGAGSRLGEVIAQAGLDSEKLLVSQVGANVENPHVQIAIADRISDLINPTTIPFDQPVIVRSLSNTTLHATPKPEMQQDSEPEIERLLPEMELYMGRTVIDGKRLDLLVSRIFDLRASKAAQDTLRCIHEIFERIYVGEDVEVGIAEEPNERKRQAAAEALSDEYSSVSIAAYVRGNGSPWLIEFWIPNTDIVAEIRRLLYILNLYDARKLSEILATTVN